LDHEAQALAVLSLPHAPDPDLSPEDVVHTICRALQHNSVPEYNAGIRRLYDFTTFECRAALTTRKGARSGPDKFVEHAELWTLPGCRSFELCGDASIIPGTQTRGALGARVGSAASALPAFVTSLLDCAAFPAMLLTASVGVDVIEELTFRFKSGFERPKEEYDAVAQSLPAKPTKSKAPPRRAACPPLRCPHRNALQAQLSRTALPHSAGLQHAARSRLEEIEMCLPPLPSRVSLQASGTFSSWRRSGARR
jgi:hypothetical protein